MDVQTNRKMDVKTNISTDWKIGIRTDRWIDRQMNEEANRLLDGQVD